MSKPVKRGCLTLSQQPDNNGSTSLPLGGPPLGEASIRRAGLATIPTMGRILSHLQDRQHIDVSSVVHTYKSRNNSSRRTQVSEAIIQGCATPFRKCNRQRNKRKNNKQDTLEKVPEAPLASQMTPDYLMRNTVTFKSDSTDDEYFEGSGTKTVRPIFVSLSKFHTTDTDGGALYQPSDSTLPVFLKVPGQNHLSFPVQKKVISVFESLESACSFQQRGKFRYVGMESHQSSYVTIGKHANQGRHGIVDSKKKLMTGKDKQALMKLVRRFEHLFCEWMHWSIIQSYSITKAVQGIPTFSDGSNDSTFFSSIAFGRNVFLGAHTDQDFGYSAVITMATEPDSVGNNILCYFVFPQCGHAVALRNMDILFFNPQVYHCVSKKVTSEDVFCISFYLKTAVVGKNDNTTPLTGIEECILNQLQKKDN